MSIKSHTKIQSIVKCVFKDDDPRIPLIEKSGFGWVRNIKPFHLNTDLISFLYSKHTKTCFELAEGKKFMISLEDVAHLTGLCIAGKQIVWKEDKNSDALCEKHLGKVPNKEDKVRCDVSLSWLVTIFNDFNSIDMPSEIEVERSARAFILLALALDNTPFGKIIRLFAFGDLKPNDIYKDPTLLHRIVKLWDKKEQGFRFGDDLFYITPEDVSCIFGLPCSGITKDLTVRGRKDEHAEFFNKYFNPNVQTITKSMLEKALDATLVGRDKADMLVLLIMLLMCTFFFANAGSTISWSLLNLCVDVRGLKALSWPHMILDFMKLAPVVSHLSCIGLLTKHYSPKGCLEGVLYHSHSAIGT